MSLADMDALARLLQIEENWIQKKDKNFSEKKGFIYPLILRIILKEMEKVREGISLFSKHWLKLAKKMQEDIPAAINRLINLTETTVASGDDDGKIKVWDTRQNTCCNSYDAHEDYIADMEFVSSTMQLLSASGDGTLSVCNVRRNKVEARSEFSEDELLSVVLVKNGRKVICGSQEGVLFLYSWGYFKDCSDRFLGHPKSIDTMLKLDEDTIITGSSDGLIRIISILPNKILGVIGEHADFPIERLAFSNDMKVLGSASHDHTIKLWDINYLIEDGITSFKDKSTPENEVSGDDFMVDDVEKDEKRQGSKRKRRKSGLSNSQKTSSSFFEDLL